MSNQETEMAFGTRFITSGSLTKIVKDPYHIREFETRNGIPDLVIVSGAKLAKIKEFEKQHSSILSTTGAARVLVILDKRSYRSVDALAHKSGLSNHYTVRILKNLEKIGAVQFNESKGYRIAREFELPSPSIVSIEFKLDNWQKALTQAVRHTAFAARSYVIMPYAKHALLEKNVETFMKFGISVGTFDSQTCSFRVIWKSPTNYRNSKPKSQVSYIDSLYRMLNSVDKLETCK